MFAFDMSVADNFASFTNAETSEFVFVDSFDNEEFSISYGTIEATKVVAVVRASSDEELNTAIRQAVAKAQ